MKKYEGSVYIGVVGAEEENGQCHDSIINIQLRPGDSFPRPARGTKGYEARQSHLDSFIEAKQFDYLLLLDSDMVFPDFTLERLRSHGLPYVSGLYMRRRFQPIAPVWFENMPKGQLTMKWWARPWQDGALYKIGASGWGCLLVHREVVMAVRELLKGEKEILEDDMDLYPYDLARVMEAVRGVQALAENLPAREVVKPAIQEYAKVFREEIRPLSGRKDQINGSDVRFPFFAKLAGYQLYGDTGVQCGHMLNYPLMPADFMQSPPEIAVELAKETGKLYAQAVRKERRAKALLRGENA